MISHILVPLDGSAMAECVLPHVLAIASAVDAQITLLHIVELPRASTHEQAADPLEWHLKKREAEVYLDSIARLLRQAKLKVKHKILEGLPAECVIDFANNNDVDLIAISTHGQSGISGWNLSSVAQKIILRSYKSTLLIRAYKTATDAEFTDFRYKRLFVGLDCSARAEYILPFATGLAKYHKAQLILGTVIRKPEMFHRFPLSDDDEEMVKRISERNYRAASHYFKQLNSQLSIQGINLQTRLIVSTHMTAALHDMVEQESADLVMLVAHGHSGEDRWPYGSVASSFIAYGTTALMILQDLSSGEIRQTQAEIAAREIKGH